MTKRVAISIAHHARDGGASGGGLNEHQLAWEVAGAMRRRLERYGVRSVVVDFSENERSAPGEIRASVKRINELTGIDLAIETHLDATANPALQRTANWSSVLYARESQRSREAAQVIARHLERFLTAEGMGRHKGALPVPGRYRTKPIWFLKKTHVPAVITEAMFISHPGAQRWLRTEGNPERLGFAIADGIAGYLGADPLPANGTAKADNTSLALLALLALLVGLFWKGK